MTPGEAFLWHELAEIIATMSRFSDDVPRRTMRFGDGRGASAILLTHSRLDTTAFGQQSTRSRGRNEQRA